MQKVPRMNRKARRDLVRLGRRSGDTATTLRFLIVARLAAGRSGRQVAESLGVAASNTSRVAQRFLEEGWLGVVSRVNPTRTREIGLALMGCRPPASPAWISTLVHRSRRFGATAPRPLPPSRRLFPVRFSLTPAFLGAAALALPWRRRWRSLATAITSTFSVRFPWRPWRPPPLAPAALGARFSLALVFPWRPPGAAPWPLCPASIWMTAGKC